jgi:nicotinamidase-related amidase
MTSFRLDVSRAALVITDPQVDFLSPRGLNWQVVGKSVEHHHTVENIERLLKAARRADMVVAISPHLRGRDGPLERLMDRLAPVDRPGRLTLTYSAEYAGADLMPQYKPYLLRGRTIITTPHRMYGPGGDELAGQLHQHHVSHVVLAGMSANLCLESHMRALLERDFEVAVVQDATAAATLPDGDAYLAAMTNCRCLANALWSTDEALTYM